MGQIRKYAANQKFDISVRLETLRNRVHKLNVMRDNISGDPFYCNVFNCIDEFKPQNLTFEDKKHLIVNRINPLLDATNIELNRLNKYDLLLNFAGQMEDRGCFNS